MAIAAWKIISTEVDLRVPRARWLFFCLVSPVRALNSTHNECRGGKRHSKLICSLNLTGFLVFIHNWSKGNQHFFLLFFIKKNYPFHQQQHSALNQFPNTKWLNGFNNAANKCFYYFIIARIFFSRWLFHGGFFFVCMPESKLVNCDF